MIERRIHKELVASIDSNPAVALLGPRQAGKTTLALEIAHTRPSLYLDLESPSDRVKLTDPEGYLADHEDTLVILDEVHRTPELFQSLRGLIDRGRRRGKQVGRFLLLGSASVDLIKQSGESLAGRIAFLELAPFDALEVKHDQVDRLWLRGGFPPSFLADNDTGSFKWRLDFIRTYLERDIPQFGPRVPAETLRRFWTMLAHDQSTLLNAATLARGLPAWHRNVGKRLVKSPKVHVRDSGLTHALLGLTNKELLLGHPVVGQSWESFVIETLIAAAPQSTEASFYRTSAGAKIDLVLTLPGGQLWAIEIKRSSAPTLEKGFHFACADLKPKQRFVVYPGHERFSLDSVTEAIGLRKLAQVLQAVR